ncbi:flagellar hook-associated family protein [Rhizobium sp. PAMB 3174]
MDTSSISNLSVQNAMRLTIRQSQNELVDAQKEVVTGTHADLGVALGAKTSQSIDLNRDVMRIQSLMDTNSLVSQRLDASQAALEQMSNNASDIMSALVALSGSDDQSTLSTAVQSASNALQAFTGLANTSLNGEYLFAGINTDVQPMTDYTESGNAAKAAFDDAFLTYFGFTQDDSAASTITATDMEDFISNTVEPMFTGSDWQTNWSSASDQNMTSRITKSEVVDSSTNTNTDGMRYFALSAVLSVELLGTNIASDVRQVVSDAAINYAGQAISGVDYQRTQLGLSQSRVSKADDTLSEQKNIIETHLSDLEGVDAYEASTRVNNLLAQVEASYTLTSRIQQLSLVNFL